MEAQAPNSNTPYDQLLNLTTAGMVPECRVGSAEQARAICNLMMLGNARRFSRNALIKGMVDGNSPWPQDKLDASNQGYRCNFNTGEAESFLNVAITAFYDLNNETETLADVVCNYGDDINKQVEWSKVITEEFDKLQRGDEEFDFNVQLSNHDMTLYGAGPRIFDDLFDWRGRPMKFSCLLIPDDAQSQTKRWVQCCYAMEYRTDELYSFIRDPESAKAVGWDVEIVKSAIINAATTWQPLNLQQGQQWEWNQQMLRNNDIYHGNKSSRVLIFRLFWREFAKESETDGRISEAWITQNSNPIEWLFKKVGRYDDWNQVIHPFFYDKGDGTAHGVRGLGVKAFKMLQAKMRLDNATVDSAQVRTAIMLQSNDGAKEINHPQHRGPYTILPPNTNFVQQSMGGVLDAPILVSHELGNALSTNLSQYRARVEPPRGNPRTKFEVQATVNQQSTLNKTQISRYYEQCDWWYDERYRRAANPNLTNMMRGGKEAMDFQEACVKRGVPKVALQRCTVTATRAMGHGNAFLRQQSLGMMIAPETGIIGALPEQGRQNLINDFIGAIAGQSFVRRYNPQPQQAKTQNDQVAQAWLQVGNMKIGIPTVVTDTQNSAIYCTVFAAAGSQAAASLQQGANPMEVVKFLELLGQGFAAHLQNLQGDRLHQDLFRQMEQIFKQLAGLHDKLIGQIQDQQKAQQEQQQKTQAAMTDEQIAQFQAQQDEQRKNAKTQADIQRKNALASQKLALSDASTANKITNETRSTNARVLNGA